MLRRWLCCCLCYYVGKLITNNDLIVPFKYGFFSSPRLICLPLVFRIRNENCLNPVKLLLGRLEASFTIWRDVIEFWLNAVPSTKWKNRVSKKNYGESDVKSRNSSTYSQLLLAFGFTFCHCWCKWDDEFCVCIKWPNQRQRDSFTVNARRDVNLHLKFGARELVASC